MQQKAQLNLLAMFLLSIYWKEKQIWYLRLSDALRHEVSGLKIEIELKDN